MSLVGQVDPVDAVCANLSRDRRLVAADVGSDPGQRVLVDQPVGDRKPIIKGQVQVADDGLS